MSDNYEEVIYYTNVCTCEGDRERETERQIEIERQIERQKDREEREILWGPGDKCPPPEPMHTESPPHRYA